MKTPFTNHTPKILLLSAACALLLPSCLPPPPGVHVRAVVGDSGYYDTLPPGYRGEYYLHGGHYYYGGRHEVGRYRWNGRTYDSRYSHNGRYYYGGRHFDAYR